MVLLLPNFFVNGIFIAMFNVSHQVKILNRHLREVVREYIIIDTKNQIDFDEFIIYNGLLVSYKSCLK